MGNSTVLNDWSSVATQAFHWSLIICGSATLTMNSMFSCMFIEFRKTLLLHNHNKILLSMTLADALVGIFSILLGSLLMLEQPQKTYKLYGIVPLFGTMFTSILSLAILTVDRLIAVKFPLRYKSIMYPNRILKLMTISWVVPALITLQESVVYIYASWKFELRLRGIILSIFFITGSVLLLIANTKLFFVIRSHMKFLQENSRFKSNEDVSTSLFQVSSCTRRSGYARAFRKEIKAAKMCITITLLFVICWAPLTAYRLSYSVGNRVGIAWLRRTCLVLACLNSLLNPLVYLMPRNGFRSYMRRIKIMRLLRKKLDIAEFKHSISDV